MSHLMAWVTVCEVKPGADQRNRCRAAQPILGQLHSGAPHPIAVIAGGVPYLHIYVGAALRQV